MSRIKLPTLFLSLFLTLALAACGGAANPEPSSGGIAAPAADPTVLAEVLTPACGELSGVLTTFFGVEGAPVEAKVIDPASGQTVPGCRIELAATGDQFLVEPMAGVEQLRTVMSAAGWQEDTSRLADGPTGTATAFRRDGVLAQLSVNWNPAAGVDCPSDQPISACNVPMAQRDYIVALEMSLTNP